MTAQPHESADTNTRLPDRNLRAIRAALTVPQDRQAFDSVRDPDGRRQMYATAEQIDATGNAPRGRPWREVLAERGVRFQVYAVGFDPIAERQVDAPPTEALGPFAELLAFLELAPWNGQVLDTTKPKGNTSATSPTPPRSPPIWPRCRPVAEPRCRYPVAG